MSRDEINDFKQAMIKVKSTPPDDDKKQNMMTNLIKIAARGHYFHNAASETFVQLHDNKGLNIWPIKSEPFEQWLAYQYAQTYRTAPSKQKL